MPSGVRPDLKLAEKVYDLIKLPKGLREGTKEENKASEKQIKAWAKDSSFVGSLLG